jgi:predicted transcriptional regulator
MTTKEQMKQLIEAQPDDASYDEIIRELAFARMVERGLADAREGRVIPNEEVEKRIRMWGAVMSIQTRRAPAYRTTWTW